MSTASRKMMQVSMEQRNVPKVLQMALTANQTTSPSKAVLPFLLLVSAVSR